MFWQLLLKYTTMKRNYLFLLLIIISISTSVIAQQDMEFVDGKDMGDSKTVYFQIRGLDEDGAERSILLGALLSDQNITDGRIFTSSTKKTRCQLFLSHNVQPTYVRAILMEYGYDFEFTSVSKNGHTIADDSNTAFTSISYSPFDNFRHGKLKPSIWPKRLIISTQEFNILVHKRPPGSDHRYQKDEQHGTRYFL
jgi:hypothetical protein